jgi:ABC-type Mn2+/Zn2+ transport system permease subunit
LKSALIAPALAVDCARRNARSAAVERPVCRDGLLVGGAGFAGGLLLAVQFDLPAGPSVVVTMVALAFASRLYNSVVD